jgi:alginate O-acetyltransferase complex protein AlgJ
MFSKKITVYIFLFVFFIPVIDGILNISGKILPDRKSTENRALAAKPDIDLTALDFFPAKYEKYYNDHFTYRNQLISEYEYFKAVWFNVSPMPEKVIIGNRGWLYNVEGELNTYIGSNRLSDSALAVLLNEFKFRKEYLQQRNCSMYIYIIPTKYVVYPEYLETDIKRVNEQSIGAQVAEYMTKHSDIPTTYLLPALLKAKNRSNPKLFCYTDTHWTEYGAYVSYKGIINQLRSRYSQLKVMNENEITTKDTLDSGGNLALMLNMETYFREPTHMMKVIKPKAVIGKKHNYPLPPGFADSNAFERQRDCNNNMPRVLVINDSYMLKMLPFFAEDFSHTTCIFDGWRYGRNESIVNTEKPDIVVYLICETLVQNILNNKEY